MPKIYPFPIFTNISKFDNDIKVAEPFNCFNVNTYSFSIRAFHILQTAGIKSIGELILFTTSQLLTYENCGVTTIKEFLEISEDVIKNTTIENLEIIQKNNLPIEELILEEFSLSTLQKLPIFSDCIINKENQKLHSSYYSSYKLSSIPFDLRTINTINRLKLKKISELLFLPKSILKLVTSAGVKTIEDIQNWIVRFYKVVINGEQQFISFQEMLSKILDIKQKNLQIFLDRLSSFGKEATLESVGNRYNLTRERVRQIVIRVEHLMSFPFIEMQFDEFFDAVDLVLDQYIGAVDARKVTKDLSELMEWQEEITPEIFLNFCLLNDKYKIDRNFYLLFVENNSCKNCKKNIKYFLSLINNKSSISVTRIVYLHEQRCLELCPVYSKHRLIDAQYLRWFIEENDELKSNFILDEEELTYFSKDAWDEKNKSKLLVFFEILQQLTKATHFKDFAYLVNSQLGTNHSQQYLSYIIQNTKQVYMWDKGTFLVKSNFNFPFEFIKSKITELIKMIEENKLPVVYINGYYEKNSKECNDHNIPNPTAFYSLLQESKDTRLLLPMFPCIFLTSDFKGSRNITEEILLFLNNNNRQYDYLELRKYFIETLGASPRSFRHHIRSCKQLAKSGNVIFIKDETHHTPILQRSKVNEDFKALNYIKLSEKNNITLKDSQKIILNEIIKSNGSITFLKIDILSRRRKQDFTKLIFNINNMFYNNYSKELIQKNVEEEIWEINYFFNNPSNWQLDLDESISVETSDEKQMPNSSCSDMSYINKDVEKLGSILNNAKTSYKIYWFQSLLYLIENKYSEASLPEMAILMCTFAWKDVLIERNKYPNIDKIPDIVKDIYFESDLSKSSTFEEIKDYIQKNLNMFIDPMLNLTRYVPYRFLSIYIGDIVSMKDTDKNGFIINYVNNNNLIYSFSKNHIKIDSNWNNLIKEKIIEYQKLIIIKKKEFFK